MELRPASEFSLTDLTRFWNLGYEGYFVPVAFSEGALAAWFHCGDFSLKDSLVALDGDHLVGFSFLGVRGSRGWIGGFGIAPAYRGRGLAADLFARHVRHVQGLRLTSVQLEVLEQNWASKVYSRAGFEIARRLSVLRGRLPGVPCETEAPVAVAEDPRQLLFHSHRLHESTPAVWQREPEWLERSLTPSVTGLYTGLAGEPSAYLLYTADQDRIRVLDAAAPGDAEADALVRALTWRHPGAEAVLVNEPVGPVLRAFAAAGLQEAMAQHEMVCLLREENL